MWYIDAMNSFLAEHLKCSSFWYFSIEIELLNDNNKSNHKLLYYESNALLFLDYMRTRVRLN